MSNVFPSMISNEPPPLESTSDEDDSEEFRTPGLKLDLFSADPSPLSTPHKSATVISPSPDLDLTQENCVHRQNACISDQLITNRYEESINNPTNITRHFCKSGSSNNDSEHSVIITEDERLGLGNYLSNNKLSEDSSSLDEFIDCQPVKTCTYKGQSEDSQSSSCSKSSEDIKDEEVGTELTGNKDEFKCALSESSAEQSDSREDLQIRDNGAEVVHTHNGKDDCCEDENFETAIGLEQKIQCVSDKSCEEAISNTKSIEKVVSIIRIDLSDTDTESEDEYEEFQDFHSQEPQPLDFVCLPIQTSTTDSIEGQFEGTIASASSKDNFGDFETFQQANSKIGCETSNEIKTSYIGELEEDDDDFGDFSSTAIAAPISTISHTFVQNEEMTCTTNVSSVDKQSDDFADFQDFQEALPSSSPQVINNMFISSITSPRCSADFSAALESKFENLVKTLIPLNKAKYFIEENEGDSTIFTCIDKELKESANPHWVHIQDFEGSKGLLYKWISSFCQQQLYNSLNIDSSTIVYTEKWGAIEVPRFAASMVETPLLQPQVCCSSTRSSDPQLETFSKSRGADSDALWDLEYSTNFYYAQNSVEKKKLSKEAQQILQQIPDISFMRARTLVFPQAASSYNSLL